MNRIGGEDPTKFVHGLFEPSDRLAVVLVNKRAGAVIQRIATADRICAPHFQAWLRHENARKYEIYISMNPLRSGAQGRTKGDVAMIRHIYLDFDGHGSGGLGELFKRRSIPVPSVIVKTSPDKWQVIWQAEGFTKDTAEDLQKNLVRETGADPAATDCARVLRLPGFYNHKYDQSYLVRIEGHAAWFGTKYLPDDFPAFPPARLGDPQPPNERNFSTAVGALSQSERDWAYAKRALSRGEPVASVIAAIAEYRRDEKPDPEYYATHTVRNAATALTREQLRAFDLHSEPER